MSQGQSFFSAEDCAYCPSVTFNSQKSLSYWIKLIEHKTSEKECLDSKYTKYQTTKGSAAFQVIDFEPNSSSIKIVPHLG